MQVMNIKFKIDFDTHFGRMFVKKKERCCEILVPSLYKEHVLELLCIASLW